MSYTIETGNRGEDLAVLFLEKRGYTILKRNFHFGRFGEIDIIADDHGVITFVEVKLRSSFKYGDPLESIPESKRKKIRLAAEGYLYINKITDKDCRLDVITITVEGTKYTVSHYKNAF